MKKDVKFPTSKGAENLGICDLTYVAEFFLANCKWRFETKRTEALANQFFFSFSPLLCFLKIGPCLVTRSMGFFFSCIHPAGITNLVMACISKDLRIKEKMKKKKKIDTR
ncbi:hypothetical protein V8C37DRAFT_384334 [Trichoderma ceciliae]